MCRTKSETLFGSSRGEGVPDAARALYLEAEREHAEGNLDVALRRHEAFLDAVAGLPAASTAHSNIADSLLHLGRVDEALREADRAVEVDPTNGLAWCTRGECLAALKRWEDSLASHRHAVELEPGKRACWSLLAEALQDVDRHEEALEAVGRALDVSEPESISKILLQRTRSLCALSRREEALACLDRIPESDPEWPFAQCLAGSVLYRLGRFELALVRFEGHPPDSSTSALVGYFRGLALKALGRNVEALKELERAADLDSADPHIWAAKGALERRLRMEEDARASLRRVLDSDPPPDVRRWTEETLDDLGPEFRELPFDEARIDRWSGSHRDEEHLSFSRDLSRWAVSSRSGRGARVLVLIDGEERGSFADSGRIAWHPDGVRYAFAARPRRKWRVATDQGEGEEFERIEPESVWWGQGDQLVFAARSGREWRWILGHHVSSGFDAVEPGSIALAPRGERAAAVARRRHGVWDARFVVTPEGELGPYDEVEGITFSEDGTRLAFIAEREGVRFAVRDGVEVGGYDDLREVRLVGPSADLTFLATRGELSFLVYDGREGPEFDDTIDLTRSPTSGGFAYLGSRGEEWFLVRDGAEEPIRLSADDPRWAQDPRMRLLRYSPDGQRIALAEQIDMRSRIHLDGRRGPRFHRIGSTAFSPDSRQFAYIASSIGRSDQEASDALIVEDGVARTGRRLIGHSLRAMAGGFAAVRTTGTELLRVFVRPVE